MPFIYVDRRKAGKGKSTPNRQKLMKRIRGYIKQSTPTAIGKAAVGSSGNPAYNNPVHVAGNALEEPRFAYAKGGTNTIVVNTNHKYNRGDEIDMDGGEGRQKGGGGPGDGGEDDFVVNIASDEFLDLFFEDCELPNLTNEKVTEKLDNKRSHAGFSTQGNPAQLSIIRSYKQALGRRKALTTPYRKEKEEIEARLTEIYDILAAQPAEDMAIQAFSKELDELEARLIVLTAKIAHLTGFDKVDLRYRKNEHKPLMTVQAALFMVMDISGSMDQEKKTIARRWFALLYAFIKRRYSTCDLVFVAHTEEAFEMSENDFFSTRVNGGTMVSPALNMVNKIITERYDPMQTNIYVSHASDGDNWDSDTKETVDVMLSKGLMNKVQHFSYVEVGQPYSWGGPRDTTLWGAYETVQDSVSPSKLSMSLIETPDKCYETFKKIFRK